MHAGVLNASKIKSEMKDELHPAWLFSAHEDGRLQCHLCAHQCRIPEGRTGICGVRVNVGGVLRTLVYGYTVSRHVDPIEKKPLYHFYPGSSAYSIATPGCNFRCRWCQNWEIAQAPRMGYEFRGEPAAPEQIVAAARSSRCESIAYTYTEPTVFFEFAYDIARQATEAGLANLLVTNGYMSPDMLGAFRSYLNAANVDLKAFRDRTYQKYMGARLQPVLDGMKRMKQLGIWLEVTTLVIPDLNDDPAELRDAAAFVAQELGPDTPWHISRFFPAYKMTERPPTPMGTLQQAREIGKQEGLRFIYIGNIPGSNTGDTICPGCGRVLIRRSAFQVLANQIRDGLCPHCGTPIAGVGMSGANSIRTIQSSKKGDHHT